MAVNRYIQPKMRVKFILLMALAFFVSDVHAEKKRLAENHQPIVLFQTTMGDFSLELYPEHAPSTVANFLQYVDQGFYSNLIFHRVIAGFMIQAGGFDTEYQARETGQAVKNESIMGLKNDRGTLAMARTNHPDSATSQFFINLKDNHFLNSHNTTPGYTVFGKVVSGMNVVDNISAVKTISRGDPSFKQAPVEMITILNAQRVSNTSDAQ